MDIVSGWTDHLAATRASNTSSTITGSSGKNKTDLFLTAGGRTISGWKSIRVTRGIERCPNDFDISMTEHYPPGDSEDVVVQPGDACQVRLGDDLVITGYVNRVHPTITPTSHTIRVAGRGKCQDLVDCAAVWPNGQISGSSVLGISRKLAKPYSISVTSDIAEEVALKPIPQVNLINSETSWDIIERICRFRRLLPYELPDGNLFLTRISSKSMASGFIQGQNVQRASVEYGDDHLFSEYMVYLMSTAMLGEVHDPITIIAVEKDPLVARFRKMGIIAEGGGQAGLDVAKQRASWERSRRRSRASQLHITTDSWRDSAGTLWTPNKLVDVYLPSLHTPSAPVAKWTIGEVTYNFNENGTTADLVLMPPEAFLPQPIMLQSYLPDTGM